MAELDTPFLNSSLENMPVEVDMLDFAYVENCDDWKKLYAIFQVLKSGKEGHYPDVSYFCHLSRFDRIAHILTLLFVTADQTDRDKNVTIYAGQGETTIPRFNIFYYS